MAKRLNVDRLGEWMDAILDRIDAEHGGSNFDLMIAMGEAMVFPMYLAPDNDDQPHEPCSGYDP